MLDYILPAHLTTKVGARIYSECLAVRLVEIDSILLLRSDAPLIAFYASIDSISSGTKALVVDHDGMACG